jgi:hypothetical protein
MNRLIELRKLYKRTTGKIADIKDPNYVKWLEDRILQLHDTFRTIRNVNDFSSSK